MAWSKARNASSQHVIFDSPRGEGNILNSSSTAGNGVWGVGQYFVPTQTGYSINGSNSAYNNSANTYVDWLWRNAFNFFQVLQVTKSAGSNLVIDLSPYMTTVGMVKVKRTDSTGSWYVWHRSLPAGQLLIGETSAAATTLGHITVAGTTLTLVNGVIADGTYHVEAYAHDASADGIIQCGSYTGNASATGPIVNLGWEPQYVLVKSASAVGNWTVLDSMRQLSETQGAYLRANTSAAEVTIGAPFFRPLATGFQPLSASDGDTNNPNGTTYIYLAIRRPNKPPTSGTQVYNAIARTGTGAAATITGVGFAPDLVIGEPRDGTNPFAFYDRLRGATKSLQSTNTNPEATYANSVTAFSMDGVLLGVDTTEYSFNWAGHPIIHHFFRRAQGVFDEVCYTGTGVASTVPHGLGAVPELMIIKRRDLTADWPVYIKPLGNKNTAFLNSTAATTSNNETHWNQTDPTASVFSLGTLTNVNASGGAYVAYLFASLPGISKVGSFTGNGTSQKIGCGFTTGARFVLIKRTDNTGDWFVWDSVRGIVAGNDPHLSLNTTAAEVTTDDSIDPDASGFIVNQVAATNINVSGGTYIYLAYS